MELPCELSRVLAEAGDPERARQMRAYMRDQFEFFGVSTPERRRLVRALLKNHQCERPAQLLLELWDRPQRELHYCACEYLDIHRNRLLVPGMLATLEAMIVTRSWWDTVDTLASHSVGGLVERHLDLKPAMDRWSQHSNLWLRRTALLFQLRYRERTDSERLFAYVDRMAQEKEFFIRKAIGWALRQYARTAPDAVRAFLATRRRILSGLSWREATKHLLV